MLYKDGPTEMLLGSGTKSALCKIEELSVFRYHSIMIHSGADLDTKP